MITPTPTRIEPFSSTELLLAWNDGTQYKLAYSELRFHCPCAGCIDEFTGERLIEKAAVSVDIRPRQVQLVGRYALQISWSDQHDTGMYHFDRLLQLCHHYGQKLEKGASGNENNKSESKT